MLQVTGYSVGRTDCDTDHARVRARRDCTGARDWRSAERLSRLDGLGRAAGDRCSNGYFPTPPNPTGDDSEYTCCPSATSYPPVRAGTTPGAPIATDTPSAPGWVESPIPRATPPSTQWGTTRRRAARAHGGGSWARPGLPRARVRSSHERSPSATPPSTRSASATGSYCDPDWSNDCHARWASSDLDEYRVPRGTDCERDQLRVLPASIMASSAGQPFVLVAEADGYEFSVGLNDADRSYIPDETTPNVHSNTFVMAQTTEGTKMLHRSTDGSILFPDMPDEWTTDATRPPSIDEDFLINVGLACTATTTRRGPRR